MGTVRVEDFYRVLFGREASQAEVARATAHLSAGPDIVAIHQLLSTPEFLTRSLQHAPEIHLFLIHSARVKLATRMLPPADVIIDLGGANAPLHRIGYPHAFQKLTIVDLPSEERCDMYKGVSVEEGDKVWVLYADAAKLDSIPSHSVDLVWAGQLIEHVSEPHSFRIYEEVSRVLRPGGHFCLDTPNRWLTQVHTGGPLIHPEHQIEYTPPHLQSNLQAAGFRIEQKLGLCEMVQTTASGVFDYTDFVLGAALTSNVDGSYIQYYSCRT